MRHSFLTAMAVLLLVASASADAMLYNITNKELKYNVILPNGVKSKDGAPLDDGVSTAASSHLIFDYRIKDGVTFEILDGLGNVVAKGPLDVNMTYLVYQDGGAYKVVPCGFYSGDGSLKAAVVANMSGETGTMDFLGQSGLDAQTGLTMPTTFDTAKPFHYANGESNYKVKFQNEILRQGLSSGRYTVVHRGPDGKINLSALGYIKK